MKWKMESLLQEALRVVRAKIAEYRKRMSQEEALEFYDKIESDGEGERMYAQENSDND